MDENSTVTENVPDLKDIEVKIGLKTPEGLLRWMREEATSHRGDANKMTVAHDPSKDTGTRSLDEKIRKLRIEMAYLRSADVKILQQLLAVHEGIEAVKWLMEERSTLTSRCSSLTSSQYSLGEGPDTSWRGSWSSLQDPNDKLDNISIGSYLDTLADDMDEYCPSSSDQSIICSSTPQASEATVAARTLPKSGLKANENVNSVSVTAKPTAAIRPRMDSPKRVNSPPTWQRKTPESSAKNSPIKLQSQLNKPNGVVADKNSTATANTGATGVQMGSPRHSNKSPSHKTYTNGKIDTDASCKLNGKNIHLEYDAHWRWVQSQEDVTFL
ncbi:leucine rich adaptor protein 1 [Boleophthalmus pectinirostris]|uniref:leucine rich adaptor protein 1 n=1 Tax=Boleophthalmus pectinirostris TaxID=150288 RepID=UPI000A1C2E90|nr:leucine rich adaptor protein 1 [Boleophthalmus pectinirostris]